MSRFSKAVTSIAVFYLGGLGIWFIDALMTGPLSIQAIVPLAIIVVGTISCIQSMRSGMRDLLSSFAFFFGLYILARGIGLLSYHTLGVFAYGMVLMLCGPLMILFASSLWAGLDYNNFRIRNVCYAVLAISAAKVFLTFLFDFHYEGILFMISDFLTIIIALDVILLSMDRSVSQSSLMQSIRESTDSMAAYMYTVDDAYILKSGCQEIQDLIDSDSDGQVKLKLFSNQIRNRMVFLNKKDGKLEADIYATGYVHINPIYMVGVRDIVIGDRYLTVYGIDGGWFRLLVHETLQEDYTKAMIFGHVIDFDKMFRSLSYFLLLRRNTRDQDEDKKGDN